ncbi:phosphatase PAP2 family protein [Novosphingobium sp. RD2P27]|uniref:Phosphatase PAP2 family protein n=1 Tax=Novosphingobium kalidii TaxID=3230299 RepID=A0ABV2D3N6_9SPHN
MMRALYLAIFDIPVMIVFCLAVSGQDRRLREFIIVFAIALVLTLLISALFPARTPLFHLIGPYPPYVPATGIGFERVVNSLRSGALLELQLHELHGILTFPSFHAASAIVFAWAGSTIRYMRWPIGSASFGMLLVTPMEGAHYFVDVTAGSFVGLGAIIFLKVLMLILRRQ